MLNAEKYKSRILEVASNDKVFGIDTKNNKIDNCSSMNCRDCLFYTFGTISEHDVNRIKWLLSEYKEPIKLTRLEYEILKWSEKEGYKYIARDEDGELCTFQSEPKKLNIEWDCCDVYDVYIELPLFKKLFQFIQWEDKEATSIQEGLNNCVVIEDVEE